MPSPVRGTEHLPGKPSPVRGLRPVRESLFYPYFPDYGGGMGDSPYPSDFGGFPFGWGGGVWGVSRDRLQEPDPKPAGMLTETEWQLHLAAARDLYDRNPQAQGILSQIVNFVGDMEVRFSLRGEKPGAIPLGDNPVDPAVAAVTDAWEDWCEAENWATKQRECRLRAFRDGEVMLRFFRGDSGAPPAARYVEPECVRTPRDGSESDEWGWGVKTDRDDPEVVEAYWVANPEDNGVTGEKVDADRVAHLKCNTDAVVKRGLSDFFPVSSLLKTSLKLLNNMGETTSTLTRYLWIEEAAPGVTSAAATSLIDNAKSYDRFAVNPPGAFGTPAVTTHGVQQLHGPTVRHSSSGQKVGAVPAQHSEAFIAVSQAVIRAVLMRWQAPEMMSGDASNANFSSSLVAGGPFVRAVEARQVEVAGWVRRVVRLVLRLCVESGRLTADQVRAVKIDVVPPAVVIVDQLAQAQRFQVLHQLGLDEPTILQECGYEPRQVAANKRAWTQLFPEDGGGGPGGMLGQGAPPEPPDGGGDGRGLMVDLLGESSDWFEEAAGRTPPRPGLVFDETKHRWVRPGRDGGAAGEYDPVELAAVNTANGFLGEAFARAKAGDAAGVGRAADKAVKNLRRQFSREWEGLRQAASQYGAGDGDPAVAGVRRALAGGLRKSVAAVGEMQASLEGGAAKAKAGRRLTADSQYYENAAAGVDEVRSAVKAATEAALNQFALLAARTTRESFDGDGLAYVTEASGKRVLFTGRRTDKLGRARCYQNGKQVACHTVDDDGAKQNARRVLADPKTATADDLRDLVKTLEGLSQEELRRLSAEFGAKFKADVKPERVVRLANWARAAAKAEPPAPAAADQRGDKPTGARLAAARERVADAVGRGEDDPDPLGHRAAGFPEGKGVDREEFHARLTHATDKWWQDRGYAMQMDEAYHDLGLGMGLSKDDFLKAVNDAVKSGKITVGDWGKTVDEIPDPELATAHGGSLMYHLYPALGKKARLGASLDADEEAAKAAAARSGKPDPAPPSPAADPAAAMRAEIDALPHLDAAAKDSYKRRLDAVRGDPATQARLRRNLTDAARRRSADLAGVESGVSHPVAADWLRIARENAAGGTPADHADELGAAWVEARKEDPTALPHMRPALAAAGLTPVGEVGAVVPFDARVHDAAADVRPGDPVRVSSEGWERREGGRVKQLARAAVEPAPAAADPAPAARGEPAAVHAVGLTLPDWMGNPMDAERPPLAHKVLIADLYDAVAKAEPGLTLDEFKARLDRGRRAGRLDLGRNDLPKHVHSRAQLDRSELVDPATGGTYHVVNIPAPRRPRRDEEE